MIQKLDTFNFEIEINREKAIKKGIQMLNNSKNKGITLIALVISIIVLLILSGISISMLSRR